MQQLYLVEKIHFTISTGVWEVDRLVDMIVTYSAEKKIE